jgi:hypothetical protein
MTLAAVFLLLLGIAGMAPVTPASAKPWTSPQSTATPSQPANAGAQAPTASQSSSSQQQPPKPPPKKIHHKKPPASDCTQAVSPANSSSPAPASDGVKPATATDPKSCPPSKVIVRQGGTAEPTVQLGGGPAGDEATQKRNVVNQLLGLTDANLKKIAGRQLAPNEQDTVTQIQQFSDQSRTARDAGDLERARVLAWKAELLSEDLVNPPK